MQKQALKEVDITANKEAQILVAGLQSSLDKFSLVPLVLAEDPQVQSLLKGNFSEREIINQRLEKLVKQTNASAIYLMDERGLTLAASNWQRPDSFVGSNYQFRDYFKQAMANGSATQFALGTVSKKPGLYIAQRVGPKGKPSGIVAVKVEFDALEASWRSATEGAFVTDRSGVILITSNPDWRFKLAGNGMPSAASPATGLERQFGIEKSGPLAAIKAGSGQNLITAPLLNVEQPIAFDGWILHLLVNPSPNVEASVANGRIILLLVAFILLLIFIWFVVLRRRNALAAEAVIAERTRTLREQLTQANRLATLGQISAGVGHEIGQPVAATRVFAETGEKLIKAGQYSNAAANFREIIKLTDRVGLITTELRQFSQRQPSETRQVYIHEIIDGAMLLLRDRVKSMGVTVHMPPNELLHIAVFAEHIRLEQVLVNLLQNSLDAAGDSGLITIELEPSPDNIRLHVMDNGPGIEADSAAQLFHPFATTKKDGLGLGLVISRDIMRELGGELLFDGGKLHTCFTMKIPLTYTKAGHTK